jgi:hypothetical protein
MLELQGKGSETSKEKGDIDDPSKRLFYLALIHMIVLNPKGDSLFKPQKNYIERLKTV